MKTPPRLVSLFLLLAGCLQPMICSAAEPVTPPPATAVVTQPSLAPSTTTSIQAAQIYENKANGFQFSLPKGWMAVEVKNPGVANGGQNVVLTINSRRAGLQIKTVLHYGATSGPVPDKPLTPEEILQQLQPGEVSVLLRCGQQGNPFNDLMRHADEAGPDLHSFLATDPIKPTTNPELSELALRFHKHGKLWLVSAFLRSPISAEDRQGLLAMLDGVHFADTPVANFVWAESLAWPHLPDSFRNLKDPPGWSVSPMIGGDGNPPSKTAAGRKTDNGFLVTFTQQAPAGNQRPRKVGTWQYLVSEDGKVTLQNEPAGSAPAAPPAGTASNAAKPGN